MISPNLTPRLVGAVLLLACLFIAPMSRAATARVNVTFAFDDAAQQGPTTGIRVEPVTPPWVEGGGVVIGDPIIRASKTSPVVITNLFGSDNTNTAIYRVTITSRVPTVYFFKCWTTNGNASDWIVAGPGQSGAWVAGHFVTLDAANSLFAKRTNAIQGIYTNGVAMATRGITNVNFTTGVTGYVSGATAYLGVTASGSSSAPSFDSTSGSGFDSQ